MESRAWQAWIGAIAVIVASGVCGARYLVPQKATDERARQSDENIAPPGSRGIDLSGDAGKLFGQGADLIEKQRPGAAIPLLRRAAELVPREGKIHHYLGYAFLINGQPDAAKGEFEEALKLSPDNVYTKDFLGRILYSENHIEQAIQLYEAIIASGMPIYDTYHLLGQAYARTGELAKALAITEQD